VLLTLFRRPNGAVIASFRSRNGDALKVAEKFQGGGHANAAGASMPKSVRNPQEAVQYLRMVLNPTPRKDAPLNDMETLFGGIDANKLG
jgi:c-di-AMP phosphodiesterase-like protein